MSAKFKYRHNALPEKVKCPYCDEKYAKGAGINAHIRAWHPHNFKEWKMTSVITSATKAVSPIIEQLAKKPTLLETVKEAQEVNEAMREGEDYLPFKCNYCGNGFTTEFALWGHIGRAHRAEHNTEVGKSLGVKDEAKEALDRYADKLMAKMQRHMTEEQAEKMLQLRASGSNKTTSDIMLRVIEHYEKAAKRYDEQRRHDGIREIAMARDLLWAIGIEWKEI